MDLISKLGISYKANYLVQGNQLERCNTSKSMGAMNTELMLRTDGKDSDIDKVMKNYKGNIIFNLPAINPDLSNLDKTNQLVKELKNKNIKLITIPASNLSQGLFEWSTLEEQKKYFLNIVTAIATLASNKIEVAIENLNPNAKESKFGSTMSQITDTIVYARRLLVKDFGFKEDDAEKYVGISLNIDNINLFDNKDSLLNYFEVFNNNIKLVKIKNLDNLEILLGTLKDFNKNIVVLMETKSELDDVKKEFKDLTERVKKYFGYEIKEEEPKKKVKSKNAVKNSKNNDGFSNIIIVSMVLTTIAIIILMVMVKLQ